MAKILTTDYETRSPVDLKSCGAYVYAENPLTDVIFLAVKEDDQVARVWVAPKFRHLVDNEIPDEELLRLIDEAEELVAHNSFFEEVITKFKMPFELELSKVRDTMAQVQVCGFPANLDSSAKIISGGKVLKDEEGAALMKKLTSPRKLVKAECTVILPELIEKGLLPENSEWKDVKVKQKDFLDRVSTGKGTYTEDEIKYFLKYVEDAPTYKRFLEYARQDVEVEYYIYTKLPKLSKDEQRVWEMSERINLRGVKIDVENAAKIERAIDKFTAMECERALALTHGKVTSMKSPSSIKKWLSENGVDTDSIDKEAVKFLLSLELKPEVREFLEIRQKTGKTSTGKYAAMRNSSALDGRIYGQFIYSGATTGRYSSKGVQIQNLSRPVGRKNVVDEEFYPKKFEGHTEEKDIKLLASGDIDLVREFWRCPIVLASDLIRNMFVAKESHDFICADFSAVEARGLAWLARQEDTLQAFREGKDLYKVAASGIYKIPYEEVDGGGKGAQRQIGKTAVLACFAADTEVLTDTGWKKIPSVIKEDKLWDGLSWVEHEGVIFSGFKKTISLDGVRLTPSHSIFNGLLWHQAIECASSPSCLESVLEYGKKSYFKCPDSNRTDTEVPNQNSGAQNPLNDCEPVYDILNAGSNHRFLIRSNSGFIMAGNCGYGGGWGAMLRFGADRLGLSEEEGKEIVKAWRKANYKIVEFWYALKDGALDAMRFPGERIHVDRVSFYKRGSFLTLRLPSGRDIYYPFAKIEDCDMPWEDKDGNVATQRLATAMTLTAQKVWVRRPLSHVVLSENVTQAACRDLLVNGMQNLEAAGYPIVMHIHDEVISEVPKSFGSLKEFEFLMAKLPYWAEGLPLVAEGWRDLRYQK